MMPCCGELGAARYAFFGMRPASHASRPASTALRIAEAIRTEPHAKTATERFRFFSKRTETVWELFLETFRIHAAVAAGSIYSTGIKSVDIEIHSIVVMEPLEKIQIRECLLFSRAFICVVNP